MSITMKLHPMSDSFTLDNLAISKDDPGIGLGSHRYEIGTTGHDDKPGYESPFQIIQFQHGPRNVVGVNGISAGALLQILIDHLQGFQSSEYRCRENACAITHLEEALFWLKSRELERVTRGVLGTLEK